jgi:hypothetical protein
VAISDFNGDGWADLAVVGNSTNVAVLLGDGHGSFGAGRRFGADRVPFSLVVGDFNGDGRPDLAVANLRSDDVSVLINKTPWKKHVSRAVLGSFVKFK